MLLRIANRENPDQTASSDLGLHCLSSPFWQANSVSNFRTFTVAIEAAESLLACYLQKTYLSYKLLLKKDPKICFQDR